MYDHLLTIRSNEKKRKTHVIIAVSGSAVFLSIFSLVSVFGRTLPLHHCFCMTLVCMWLSCCCLLLFLLLLVKHSSMIWNRSYWQSKWHAKRLVIWSIEPVWPIAFNTRHLQQQHQQRRMMGRTIIVMDGIIR